MEFTDIVIVINSNQFPFLTTAFVSVTVLIKQMAYLVGLLSKSSLCKVYTTEVSCDIPLLFVIFRIKVYRPGMSKRKL